MLPCKGKMRYLLTLEVNRYCLLALQSINVDLQFGYFHVLQCFGLLGENGAGKSTTFNMMTGELLPTRGQVLIDDTVWV